MKTRILNATILKVERKKVFFPVIFYSSRKKELLLEIARFKNEMSENWREAFSFQEAK